MIGESFFMLAGVGGLAMKPNPWAGVNVIILIPYVLIFLCSLLFFGPKGTGSQLEKRSPPV
jgi:hypothetical protein